MRKYVSPEAFSPELNVCDKVKKVVAAVSARSVAKACVPGGVAEVP
jgi:hypothetical protein